MEENSYGKISDIVKEAESRASKYAEGRLVELYFEIGKIVSLGEKGCADTSFVENLSARLLSEYPGNYGFTPRGLKRMARFYGLYRGDADFLPLLFRLDWPSHLKIMSSCKSREERFFYMTLAVKEGLSAEDLEKAIDSALFERFMFSDGRPGEKTHIGTRTAGFDGYTRELLGLPAFPYKGDAQEYVVSNMTEFIMRADSDYTYMKRDCRLGALCADVLFFHRALRCTVALIFWEGGMGPEIAGKMSRMLSALDKCERRDGENPSAGIVLFASEKGVEAEFFLGDSLSADEAERYLSAMPGKELLRGKLLELWEVAEGAKIAEGSA